MRNNPNANAAVPVKTGMRSHKKILFPIGEREFFVTSGRILDLPKRLTDAGYKVDVMTYDDKICDQIKEKLQNCRANIIFLKNEQRFWTMAQRDNFAKTFIKLTHDIYVPGTDFKFWKQTGFDDFLWNFSVHAYPAITEKYDLVLLPIPSSQEAPPGACDAFYTHLVFYAKQHNIPIAGIQIFPVIDMPHMIPKAVDYFMVKEQFEKDFFIGLGIPDEKIFIIDEIRDNYSMTTIEDPYRNFLLDNQLKLEDDCLGIIVMNHTRNRSQISDVLETISGLDIKKALFFCFTNYVVRDLQEKDVFKDLMQPVIERLFRQYYSISVSDVVRVLMFCDVIVSTSYILPVSFARKYNKAGIIYNPLQKDCGCMKDALFADSKKSLKDAILGEYGNKLKLCSITSAMDRIIK